MEDKMVELVRFSNTTEAEMLVNLLQSEGVESYVREAFASQVFGGAGIGAKVELLEKDVARAQQIMCDNGYEVSGDLEEMITSENSPADNAEYEKSRKKLANTMTIFIVLILIVLALLFFINGFYK
ncbi:MAG: DUF2007 domain-containing protein [Tannerella sp.]|jgi:predicted nucleic acid-binding Zn ribbon protein|nr:DUF2007 domain-containing protein [Tannerella sp.]